MRHNQKAQVVSFDFVTSVIVFVLIILVLVGAILLAQRSGGASKAYEFEMEYLYANLEHNLGHDIDQSKAFLDGNRVDAMKLSNFVASHPNEVLDDYVIGNIEAGNEPVTHGIGLDSMSYDTCLYLTDNKGIVELGTGIKAIGTLKEGQLCNNAILAEENPCEGYRDALALFKPVLYDTGSPATSRIIQLNLVVCRR
jgi:hypothetical protein